MDDVDVEDGVKIEVEDDQNVGGIFDNRELNAGSENSTPETIALSISAVNDFVSAYGWYILFALLGLWYLKSRFDSQIQSFQSKRRERNEHSRYDTSELLQRQEAIERARQKMQEEHQARAEEYAARQKQKQEEKRKAEIEDWDRHQTGKGYKSKVKVTEDYYPSTESKKQETKPKKRIRGEYNPLMGAGGGVGFHPPRRNFSSGGGG